MVSPSESKLSGTMAPTRHQAMPTLHLVRIIFQYKSVHGMSNTHSKSYFCISSEDVYIPAARRALFLATAVSLSLLAQAPAWPNCTCNNGCVDVHDVYAIIFRTSWCVPTFTIILTVLYLCNNTTTMRTDPKYIYANNFQNQTHQRYITDIHKYTYNNMTMV